MVIIRYYVYQEHLHQCAEFYITTIPPVKPKFPTDTGNYSDPINKASVLGFCETCARMQYNITKKEDEFLKNKDWTVAQKRRYRTNLPYYDQCLGSVNVNEATDLKSLVTLASNALNQFLPASFDTPDYDKAKKQGYKGKYYLSYRWGP